MAKASVLKQELQAAVEIVPKRLYFGSITLLPDQSLGIYPDCHFFSFDPGYVPVAADTGPHELKAAIRFCQLIKTKLADPSLKDKKMYYHVSHDSADRTMAASLVGFYAVLALEWTPMHANRLLLIQKPSIKPFVDCDASDSVIAVLWVLQMAVSARRLGWINLDEPFNSWFRNRQELSIYQVVPGKIACGRGRCLSQVKLSEQCVQELKEANVKLVIQFSQVCYDPAPLTAAGIEHRSMYLMPVTVPSRTKLYDALRAIENCDGQVLLHAGPRPTEGRAMVVACAYIVTHYGIPAVQVAAWARMCQPASLHHSQQEFLALHEQSLLEEGLTFRNDTAHRLSLAKAVQDGQNLIEREIAIRVAVENEDRSTEFEPRREGEYSEAYRTRILKANKKWQADIAARQAIIDEAARVTAAATEASKAMPVPEWTGVEVPADWWDKGVGRDLENFPREAMELGDPGACD